MDMKMLRYYRSGLDSHDQAVYDRLMNGFMTFSKAISVSRPHRTVSEIVQAIMKDCPTLFFVDSYRMADYLLGVQVSGNYLCSWEEAKQKLQQCISWGEQIRNLLPAGLGVNEKALWLHDVIIKNAEYGECSDSNRTHNMLGVILERRAVCDGIAKTYKFLCDLCDVPCIYLEGTLHGEPHGWNLIWTSQGPSFVDVTADLSDSGPISRRTFLMSQADMVDYQWDQAQLPKATVSNARTLVKTACSREDALDIVRSLPRGVTLTLYLRFGQRLTTRDMEALVNHLHIRCPRLLTRSVFVSEEGQFIIVQ